MQNPSTSSILQKIVARYFSNSLIFLLIALLVGTMVRFETIAGREFPLNDGGYWYVFTQSLINNRFVLPEFVQFNGAPLPTYYPPLAGYLLGTINSVLGIDLLTLQLWIPFLLCLSMILSFYALAIKLYDDQLTPRFAIILFALSPLSYRWFLMGGGVSRGLGIVFLMLSLTLLLSKSGGKPRTLTAGALAGLAALSHPVAGLLVSISACILLFCRKISLKSLAHFYLTVGVVIAPWFTIVVSRTGLKPFLSAFMSGDQGMNEFLSAIATSQTYSSSGIFAAFAVLGLCYGLTQGKSFSAILFLSMALLCPLFLNCGFGCIPLALMSAEGASLVYRKLRELNHPQSLATGLLLICLLAFLGFTDSIKSAHVISKQSMTNEEFKEIREFRLPEDAGHDVLVLTQHQVVGDAVGEWLTAFTGYRSVLTHQMGEWSGELYLSLIQQGDFEKAGGPSCQSAVELLKNKFPNAIPVVIQNQCNQSGRSGFSRLDLQNTFPDRGKSRN